MHGNMFCSILQFKTWYEKLVRKVEQVVKYEQVLRPEEPDTKAKTVFESTVKEFH